MTIALVCILAVLLDTWFGEPQRAHPLVAFRRWADRIEAAVLGRRAPDITAGLALWAQAIGPLLVAALLLARVTGLALLLDVLVLFLALGANGIGRQALEVVAACRRGDLPAACEAARWMAARDVEPDESAVAAAAVHGVFANATTAVFGPLFWYAIAGAPGVLLFRLTMALAESRPDTAMGAPVQRIASVLNWVPERIGAVSFALVGDGAAAWRQWHRGDPAPAIAVGTAAAGLNPGGPGIAPRCADIPRSVELLQHALWFWLVSIVAIDLLLV